MGVGAAEGLSGGCASFSGNHLSNTTHGSVLIRRQCGPPGVVLPLFVSNSADR